MTQAQLDALKEIWISWQNSATASLSLTQTLRQRVIDCRGQDISLQDLALAYANPSTYNKKCGDFCGANQRQYPDTTACSPLVAATGVARFKALVLDALNQYNDYLSKQNTANEKKKLYDDAVASNVQQLLSDPGFVLQQQQIAADAEVAKEKAKQRTKIFIGIGITIAVLVIAYFVFKKFIFKTA